MTKPYNVWIATRDGTHKFRIDALCMDDAIAAARLKLPTGSVILWTGSQRAD